MDRSRGLQPHRVAAGTLTHGELLALAPEQILRRLFWDETLRMFEPMQPRFSCTCSRQRVDNMLKGLGREEIDSVVAERGEVEVGCDFCGAMYRFDAVDVGGLFAPERDQSPGSQAIN
jgi:molecular chaperone Hsp33